MCLTKIKSNVLACLAVIAVLASPVTMANEGVVRGYVKSASSGVMLPGARITVQGSGITVYTDNSGRFVLQGLDLGDTVLQVNYVGFEPTETRVNVGSVATDMTIELGTEPGIEVISVVSQRTALNDAMNRYRSADSISNYISADDIGQFVDQNVAESLQRLPGVSISRDQGEGRFVSVRGVEAALSTVTINGMRIGTPEDGSRDVPLDVIPTGSVDLLVVTKVPTPDMPGDAIGGSVDVRSASAFDRDSASEFSYRVEGSWNELSKDISPKLQANYGNLFSAFGGEDNFGISVGLNYLDRKLESDNVEAEYDYNDDLGQDEFVLKELQQRKYYVNRERLGANINLEFRPDFNSRYYLNTLFSRFKDAEVRQRSIYIFDDGDLTEFDGTAGRYEDIDEDGFRRRIRFRTKDQDTLAMAVGGENVVDSWTFDYQLGHSITRERVPDENEGRFENDVSPLNATFRQGNGIPEFTILDGTTVDLSHRDNANYVFDRAVLEPKIVDDNDTNFSLNAEYRGAFGYMPLTLKSGFDARMKSKFADIGEEELRNVPDVRLDQFTSEAPSYGLGDIGQGISADDYLNYFTSNRDQIVERPRDVDENIMLNSISDFEADEDVIAGYLMGTFDFAQLRLIAGARLEHTDFSAEGTELTIDADGDLSVGTRSAESNYTNILPGLHMRYEPNENVVLRAAWSNTLARPSFSDISPRFSINNEDLEIETGNPDLDPYKSMNLDLLMDWYIGAASVISAGVFYKDIDNYIVDFTTDNDPAFAGFEVSRPVNGTEASVKGLEFNVQHDLGAWTGALNGFLLGANFTLLDTDLELMERPGETFQLPQSSERSGNIYLGYENGPFSGRISLSHRNDFLTDIGDSTEFDVYVQDHTQLDLTASYRIMPNMELVLEATNLTDAPLELYQGTPDLTLQFEEYGRTVSLGLTGRF